MTNGTQCIEDTWLSEEGARLHIYRELKTPVSKRTPDKFLEIVLEQPGYDSNVGLRSTNSESIN